MHDWSILYLPNAIQDEIKSHGLYEDLEYLDLSEWKNTRVLVQELKNLLD